MSRNSSASREPEGRGYALLFVLFLMALVIIGASAAALDQLTEGRRDKEAVMIWRGQQYQRAIGLYYRKFGRFPTNIDNLVKVQNGEVRFLREAYKNPMNSDGKWRFIYVTPAGQLIGSVQYVSLQQMAFIDQQRRLGLLSRSASSPAGASNSDSSDSFGSNLGGQSGTPTLGANAGGTNVPSAGGAQIPPQFQPPALAPSGQQPGSSSFFTQPLQAQPGTAPGSGLNVQESSSDSSDNGPVIGGFIIGVAGTQDKPSIKIYKGGATYKRWEFIFNPLEQVRTMGTVSVAPAKVPGTPFGNQPQAPNPPQQPPQIPQTPQQPR